MPSARSWGYADYKTCGYDDNQPIMYYRIWQSPRKYLDKIETVTDMYYGEYMTSYDGITGRFNIRPESSVKAQLVMTWCACKHYNAVTPESNQLIDTKLSHNVIF